ncbi:hypothetical protein FB451DRAFT_1519332 [Mycena latifolia]|nr:hypothetical protein FB451DRAFT_1519332 [Mycena latifolia]
MFYKEQFTAGEASGTWESCADEPPGNGQRSLKPFFFPYRHLAALALDTMHASLRLKNVSKLSEPLKVCNPPPRPALATSAANGSLDDLAKLFSLISESPQPQLRFFVPAFYANLNPAEIPALRAQLEIYSPFLQDRNSRAILAVKGLSVLQEHLISLACQDVWVSAWQWIQFLEVCEEHRPGAVGPSRYMVYLQAISSLSRDQETAVIIKSAPGVRGLFAKGWSAAVAGQFSDTLLADTCQFILHHLAIDKPENLEEVIEGAGGTVNDLASLIVKHVCNVVPHKEHHLTDTDGLAILCIYRLLESTVLARTSPLGDALLAQGIVKCVATVLCALFGPAMSCTEHLITLSFAVLVHNIIKFPGYPWAKEALEGLLRAIVLSTGRYIPQFDIPLDLLLRETLPGSLVYHSVFSSLHDALEEAKSIQDTLGFRASAFLDAWSDFVNLSEERLEVKRRYDSGELSLLSACDNLECGKILKDAELLRCVARQHAFYCSRLCQIVDWKAGGHRKSCASPPTGHPQEAAHLGARDYSFLRALLHHDYEAARADILAQQIVWVRANPRTMWYVKLDYVNGRMTSEVGPVMQPGMGLAARVVGSGGRMEMHVMMVSEGGPQRHGTVLPLRSSNSSVHERLLEISRGKGGSSGGDIRVLVDGLLRWEATCTH